MRKADVAVDDLLALGRLLSERAAAEGREPAAILLARNLLRIRDREGHESGLLANAAQRSFERKRKKRNIVLKARQMGVSTWVAGQFFLKTVTARGVLTVQVAQTREAAESIFRMVQRFWDCLPADLRKGSLRRSRANVGQMVFRELDSEYRVLSASDENAGRGLTIQNLHCSEVSRWPGDAAATLAGLRAALAPGGELTLESTPNGAYGCFYEEWQQAGERGVARHFYPWWLEQEYSSAGVTDVREEELDLILGTRLATGQIGFRRTLEASYRGLRTQEFAESPDLCFRSSGECCFDMDAVESRLAMAPDPVEIRRNGTLHIWLPPMSGKEYLVAVDTAGGGSDGDYAAVQVIEVSSGLQCAELRQHLGTLELARTVGSLAREYTSSPGKGALVVVERNNHGAAVLAYLDAVEGYRHLYEHAGSVGWLTTAASKPALMSRLGALLVESPWLFLSKRLLEECRSFITHAGGRTGAARGAHDDCVMAMGIAQAVRAERLESRRVA
jgi:hypothetical protein